jgi:hypothetical protein
MDVSEEISHVDQRLEDILSVFFASNPDLSSTSDMSMSPTISTNETSMKGGGTSFLGGEEDERRPTIIPEGLKDMNNLPEVNLLSDNTINTSDQQNNYDLQWSINTVETLEQDSEQKSPSPLIYPGRTVKVRKTLAAVELPNFPPQSQNQDGGR